MPCRSQGMVAAADKGTGKRHLFDECGVRDPSTKAENKLGIIHVQARKGTDELIPHEPWLSHIPCRPTLHQKPSSAEDCERPWHSYTSILWRSSFSANLSASPRDLENCIFKLVLWHLYRSAEDSTFACSTCAGSS